MQIKMCNGDHNNLMERDAPSVSVQLIGGGHLASLLWQNADKCKLLRSFRGVKETNNKD
jgi:hypothetical protein